MFGSVWCLAIAQIQVSLMKKKKDWTSRTLANPHPLHPITHHFSLILQFQGTYCPLSPTSTGGTKTWSYKSYIKTQMKSKENKKTLCIITMVMICSSLASLWKFQYFRGSIYDPVKYLWWSLYCKNSEPLSIFTKKLHHRCLL